MIVDPSFVRPSPPSNPRRNTDNDAGGGGDFALLDVVDAYNNDGWCVGVITKVISNGELRKYVVYFDSIPAELEFERSQLRLHVDWIDCRWLVPMKKTPDHKSANKNAAQTPESRTHAYSRNKTVSAEENSHGGKGNTKVMEASGSHATHLDSPILEKDINITKTSEAKDGKSQQKRKRGRPPKLQRCSSDQHDESSGHLGSKGNTKVMEESEPLGSHQDSLPVEQEMIITQESYEAEDGKSQQKRKRGRPPKQKAKRANGSPSSDQHDKPSGGPNPAMINDGETTDYQQDWPFTKRSPIWATIESMELYQKLPQKPHFSPLKKLKEDFREGLAIAHMVTFSNVFQRTLNVQFDTPSDVIKGSFDILTDLENHGFNVDAIRVRLNNILSWKEEFGLLKDTLEEAEKEIEKHEREKSIFEVETNQLEAKIKELEEKLVQSVTIKKVKDEEIKKLQSNLHLVADQIMDVKSTFEKIAATPL